MIHGNIQYQQDWDPVAGKSGGALFGEKNMGKHTRKA